MPQSVFSLSAWLPVFSHHCSLKQQAAREDGVEVRRLEEASGDACRRSGAGSGIDTTCLRVSLGEILLLCTREAAL